MKNVPEKLRAAVNRLLRIVGLRLVRVRHARSDVADIDDTREDFRARLATSVAEVEALYARLDDGPREGPGPGEAPAPHAEAASQTQDA